MLEAAVWIGFDGQTIADCSLLLWLVFPMN